MRVCGDVGEDICGYVERSGLMSAISEEILATIESEWARSDDDWKMGGFVRSNIDARSVKFYDKLREVKRNYENCRDPTIFVDMQRDFKRKYEI